MNPSRSAYLMALAADDLAGVLENMVANARGAALAGPEGPEPDKRSPRYRAASLSQDQPREPAPSNKRAGRNS